MSLRKLRLKPIVSPDTWPIGDRCPWEETGQIYVLAHEGVQPEVLEKVANTVRGMMEEFSVPLTVQVDAKSARREAVIRLINETKRGKQLDNQPLVRRINQERKTLGDLRPGLVILLDPNEFDEFRRPGEKKAGIFGTTDNDGVSLLRCYRDEAVRHEFAHMLGLEPHHDEDPNCVMNWTCPSRAFCPSCAEKLRSIIQITDE